MTITHIDAYHQPEERRFELLKRQPEYTREYTTKPRTCARPSCAVELSDRLAALCPACQADLDGTLAEIAETQARAKAERLARQGVNQ